MNIRIFSLGCPKCNYIIALAQSKKLQFETVSDEKQVLAEADKNNFNEIPFAIIDGRVYDSKGLEEYLEGIK